MAKKFSFIAENVTPLSQNNRSSVTLRRLQNDLTAAHNMKYPLAPLPKSPLILDDNLQAKVFYIHRAYDHKDADNISKPIWDCLNKHAYNDDKQIRYIETLKIHVNTVDLVELNTATMDNEDYAQLLNFVFDTSGTKQRLLYINVSDYESKNVRF